MDLKTIADALVQGCRTGDEIANLDRLYAADAVSVEAVDHGTGRSVQGRDAIRAKHEWWASANEMTGGRVSDPMFHGDDRFAVIFAAEGRDRASGQAFSMTEVGIYTVAEGKIVREEFFYGRL